MTAVRMATLNRASPPGATSPTAPVYTPRGSDSSAAMISIVRCFGAPVTDAEGNVAAKISSSGAAVVRP